LGLCSTIDGQNKSFQVPWKVIIAMVARTGAALGNIILENSWNGPAPSIFAASSNSLGIVKKY